MTNSIKFLVAIATYVLTALGTYAIAKRRGINHPWLAWVPVGNVWLLGCISDQYRYVARGEVKTKRKKLLGFTIATWALGAVILGLGVALVLDVLPYLPEGLVSLETLEQFSAMSDVEIEEFIMDLQSQIGQPTPSVQQAMLIKGLLMGLFSLALTVVSVTLVVLNYMAYFDLFVSCNPRHASTYLTLGILEQAMLVGILMPIFVFVCRELDEGMPPRQPQIVDMPMDWDQPAPPSYEL